MLGSRVYECTLACPPVCVSIIYIYIYIYMCVCVCVCVCVRVCLRDINHCPLDECTKLEKKPTISPQFTEQILLLRKAR